MRTVAWTALVAVFLLLGAEVASGSCITRFGTTPADVDCTLIGPSWVPQGAPGQILLFKNIWGKGKRKRTGELVGPTKAGVGLAGPLCWAGASPVLTLTPTTPDDGTPPAWTVPDLVEWQAVKTGGVCQLCCSTQF